MLTPAEVAAHLADAQHHTTRMRGAVRAEVQAEHRGGTLEGESSRFIRWDGRQWVEREGKV